MGNGEGYAPNKNKNKFVKQTLSGLMLSGSPHAPSGPIR